MKYNAIVGKPVDINIPYSDRESNPFYTNLSAVFSHDGKDMVVPGFFKNERDGYAIRFSAPEPGIWTYRIYVEGVEIGISGNLEAIASSEMVKLDIKSTVRPVFHQGDAPFFLNAYECDWLFAFWMTDEKKAKDLILKIKGYEFNSIVMDIYAHECTWTDPKTPGRLVPPPLYCWDGSNEVPDHGRLNTSFFEKFDALIEFLRSIGMYAQLYFYVYNKRVALPKRGSQEEEMYFKQMVARYQAFPNILWIYAKETFYNSDKENIKTLLRLIKSHDAYNHLVTVQDDKILMNSSDCDNLIDYYMLQQHQDFATVTSDHVLKKVRPVFNAEFGYEPGESLLDRTYTESQLINEYIDRAWEVVLSGGHSCYYYTFTAWDVIRSEDTPPGYALFKYLYQFITSVQWAEFIPEQEFLLWTPSVCMKRQGMDEYLIKTNHLGKFLMPNDCREHSFKGTWLNIYTGEQKELTLQDYASYVDIDPALTVFTSPFAKSKEVPHQAVLHVTMYKL